MRVPLIGEGPRLRGRSIQPRLAVRGARGRLTERHDVGLPRAGLVQPAKLAGEPVQRVDDRIQASARFVERVEVAGHHGL